MTICSVVDCGKSTGNRKELCEGHYAQLRRIGQLGPLRSRIDCPKAPCSVADCERTAETRGLCRMHYKRELRRTGPLPKDQWKKPVKQTQRRSTQRQRNLEILAEYKAGGCVDCGNADIRVLDCHHYKPCQEGERRMSVRAAAINYGEARFLEELHETMVLCANCHRIRHADGDAG